MMGGFKYYSSECLFINEFNKALIDEFNFLCKYANKIILTIPIQYEDFLKIDNKTLIYLKNKNFLFELA